MLESESQGGAENRPFVSNGRVYVLGAGASVFAGYPLATSLLSFIRTFRTLEARAREIGSAVLEKLSEAEFQFTRHIAPDPNGRANLEELLTYLELYHSFPLTSFAANPWSSADSDVVRRVIADKFLFYQHDLYKAAWTDRQPVEPVPANPSLVRKVAQAWASRIQPGDVIITFNWDLLHEVVLWKSELWSYRDGYGFLPGTQGQSEPLTKVLLLKLHGSVNWIQREVYEPVSEIANVPDFFAGAKDYVWRAHHNQAQTDSGRKLLLPTYLKDISSNVVLLDLWTQAHRFISRAKEVVVIGYSLHPVDHPVRLLFGTALSENRALSHVTIASPEAMHWATFLPSLGKKMVHVRQRFEEWVCN